MDTQRERRERRRSFWVCSGLREGRFGVAVEIEWDG